MSGGAVLVMQQVLGIEYCTTHDEIIDERNGDACRGIGDDELAEPCSFRELWWRAG